MLRYAFRAVPWWRLAAATGLVLVLMEVVRRWPWTMWPLQGCAVGVVAAATLWCFDEPSADIVDVTPRPLAWRTAARASGVLLVAQAWGATVLLARSSLFDHASDVALQGFAALLAAASFATWRRAGGTAVPARASAALVVVVAAFCGLVRPGFDLLPLFPYADGSGNAGDWATSRVLWASLAGVAVVGLMTALADVRWWRWGGSQM